MIDRAEIRRRLELHILNVCLAALVDSIDDLRQVKDTLLDEVEKLVAEASDEPARKEAGK